MGDRAGDTTGCRLTDEAYGFAIPIPEAAIAAARPVGFLVGARRHPRLPDGVAGEYPSGTAVRGPVRALAGPDGVAALLLVGVAVATADAGKVPLSGESDKTAPISALEAMVGMPS